MSTTTYVSIKSDILYCTKSLYDIIKDQRLGLFRGHYAVTPNTVETLICLSCVQGATKTPAVCCLCAFMCLDVQRQYNDYVVM